MASALRIKSTNQWKGTGSTTNHCKIISLATNVVPEAIKGTDRIANTHLDGKKYELLTEDKMSESELPTYKIYTDAAKNDSGAGCGYYSSELGLSASIGLNKTITVLQAETMGLLLAAQAVFSLNPTSIVGDQGATLEFVTDSAAIIYALRRPTTRSKVLAKCHAILQTLATECNLNVKVKWTRSHAACTGNISADKLAKEGAKLQVSDDVMDLCRPSSMEVRDLLRRHTESEQQRLWNNTTSCKHTKVALPTLDKKITNNLLKLQRQDLRLIVGLITGHCNLNYHLHKIGATDSPLCRGCMSEDETVEHVILHCPVLNEMRTTAGLHKQDPDAEYQSQQQQQHLQSSSSPSALDLSLHPSLQMSRHTHTHSPPSPLEALCQQPKAVLRFVKELGWLG